MRMVAADEARNRNNGAIGRLQWVIAGLNVRSAAFMMPSRVRLAGLRFNKHNPSPPRGTIHAAGL